jgi:arylsulfatase A-like enzyme
MLSELKAVGLSNNTIILLVGDHGKYECINVQGDQKVSVHLMITVQNTRKNILNSFSQLP